MDIDAADTGDEVDAAAAAGVDNTGVSSKRTMAVPYVVLVCDVCCLWFVLTCSLIHHTIPCRVLSTKHTTWSVLRVGHRPPQL
jgi:hypothetical protein